MAENSTELSPRTPRTIVARWLRQTIGYVFSPILIAAVFLPVTYVSTGLYEATRNLNEPLSVSQISGLKAEADRLTELIKANPDLETATAEVRDLETSVFSSRTNKIIATMEYGEVRLRYQNSYRFESAGFVFAAGLWLIAVYLIWWSWKYLQSTVKVSAIARRLTKKQVASARTPDRLEERLTRTPIDELEAIDQDVYYARTRADQVFNRSTVLLVSGIAMAIIGVAVFYFSLPQHGTVQSLTDLLLQAARPGAILFFLEAVAWFLLRQYRALSVDYKEYHDVASQRADLLASLQLARRINSPDLSGKLMSALLERKSEAVLQPGQSTKALELEKLGAGNPVVDVIQSLITKIPEPISAKKEA